MIITLTGKKQNVGDYLISYRAHALLKKFVDEDLLDISRFALPGDFYEQVNKAKALFLCGGPAYQEAIYPNIYNIDLDKIKVPVIPYGLGFKAVAGVSPKDFRFKEAATDFVKRVHAGIPSSSARDPLTKEALKAAAGVENVTMTGCPATYDLDCLDKEFPFKLMPETIVLSGPAIADQHTFDMVKYIAKRFPKARKILALHHGYWPTFKTKSGIAMSMANTMLAGVGTLNGFEIANLAADLPKMFRTYDQADLHIGYRVHGHLYCISRRIPSFLICEDTRGEGQAGTLGLKTVLSNAKTVKTMEDILDRYVSGKGRMLNDTLPTIHGHFETMRGFLEETRSFIEQPETLKKRSA